MTSPIEHDIDLEALADLLVEVEDGDEDAPAESA